MPTNEELHEIEEIMRDGARFSVSSCAVAPRLGLECEEFETCAECESRLAERLADLIEPKPERTCGLRSRFTGMYCYECSKCGRGMKADWAYYPKCGAKVVER